MNVIEVLQKYKYTQEDNDIKEAVDECINTLIKQISKTVCDKCKINKNIKAYKKPCIYCKHYDYDNFTENFIPNI